MTWDWSIDGWMILAGVLSACSCALIGSFLVLRRMSLMGDAISHAVLPGLAMAFILSGSRGSVAMLIGAVVVGLLTAVGTQMITRYGRVEQGAAMGVVFSVLFALGLVLIRQAAEHVDLDPGCVLYGNLAYVPLDALEGVPTVVRNLAIAMVANVLFVVLLYKELKITSFDPALATTLGIPANLIHYLLMIMVAITTVANFEAVGSIMVIGMLIVPAATAMLLTDRLWAVLVIGQMMAALAAVVGHPLAVYGPGWIGLNATADSAATMTTVSGIILLLAVVAAPRHGLVSRVVGRMRLSLRIVRQDVLGLLYRASEAQPTTWVSGDILRKAAGKNWHTSFALWWLGRKGSVEREPGGALMYRLTGAGREEAKHLIGGHRLWESYVARHWELPPDHLHEPAERMEHYLTKELTEKLREDLTDPTHDPHGQPIP